LRNEHDYIKRGDDYDHWNGVQNAGNHTLDEKIKSLEECSKLNHFAGLPL
jgi:hypothetical protein